MSTSHRQIVSVRGVLSHACLRKANWDIGMVTGFCHSPGIAVREEEDRGFPDMMGGSMHISVMFYM